MAAPAVPAAEVLELRLLHPAARPPRRAHDGDAGYDLACVEPFTLWPGTRRVVGTGVAIALPPGIAGLVVPRSGLAVRYGLAIVNTPGLIDPGYRGEIRVPLLNTGDEPFTARAGERIAQLLMVPFWTPELRVAEDLPAAGDGRDVAGLGSTGR
jgi:dUTP diphosphatase